MNGTSGGHTGLDPALLGAMVAADSDVVVVGDDVGRVRWVNPAVGHVLGWSPQQFRVLGAHLVHPDDQADLAHAAAAARERPGAHHLGVARHLGARGAWHVLEVTAINLLDEHGVLVTRLRDLRNRETPVSDLDEVTALPTRAMARTALEARLRQAKQQVAVLFCDLDGFKAVNDDHGHLVGDRVLRAVAQRFSGRLRTSEMLVRWGGDEFVVLVDVPGPALAVNVAARLHQAVQERAIGVDGAQVSLGVSIGIALGDRDGDIDDLIHRADRAMYEAKRAGGGIATEATIAA